MREKRTTFSAPVYTKTRWVDSFDKCAAHHTHTFWHIFGENPGALVWDTLVRENSLSYDLQQQCQSTHDYISLLLPPLLQWFFLLLFPMSFFAVSLFFGHCCFRTQETAILDSNQTAAVKKSWYNTEGGSFKGRYGANHPFPPFPLHPSTYLWVVLKMQWREKLFSSYLFIFFGVRHVRK